MTPTHIFFGLALFILVALFLARPFLVTPTRNRKNLSAEQLLLDQKEAMLVLLRTLEFDHDTGKVPVDIYQAQRAALVSEAAAVLQKLDELAGKPATTSSDRAVSAIDAEIEAAIARVRQAQVAMVRPAEEQAATGQATPIRSGGYCPQCGQPVETGDNFCAVCGHQLVARQPVA